MLRRRSWLELELLNCKVPKLAQGSFDAPAFPPEQLHEKRKVSFLIRLMKTLAVPSLEIASAHCDMAGPIQCGCLGRTGGNG